ncbi:hypothetical protein CK203_098250 [Vitis vinifera]|uniref:Retrotransposon gag domain-containing protein n=2 Tax=Vitis vinifera TaxID=29760 RepID=A0A438DHM4_VITVI|nr:hypothetical protein CK203_098250 [Vitis vinifera]
MDTQQSRYVALEDMPSDIVTPPALPVQMSATQTLPTVSHDHAVVIPPMMRDPDEMISWDDPDDVPVATLPAGFRMPDIERYTGVGCPRIHLRLYSTVMRALGLDEAQLLTLFPLSLSGMTQRWYASLETSRRRTWEGLAQEFLRQYSFSGDTSATRRELELFRQGSDEPVSSFISRWREKAAEMIERPTEGDQMSMFLRSLHPRFARHLTGVPFQDFRSLVQALSEVDDGISRGLWSDIIPSLDTEGKGVSGSSESYGDVCSADFHHRRPDYHPMRGHCRYPGVISHPYRIVILIQLSSILLCILILSRCDLHFIFGVHRLVSHGMSSLVPIGDVRGLILIWRCLWIELLSDSELLMVGHRTDYCASLRHTIQDLIDSGAVSLPISTTDTDLGPDMTVDSFPVYSTHAVPPPSGLYHHLAIRVRTLCFESSPYCLIFRMIVLDSFSIMTGPRAEIDGMMVMIFSEYIEIRLLQLRFTMSDEIAPITLTTLYEMMVDLTRRVERIELILSGHPSSSRGAPGVAMPSLPHLTSSTPATLGASHPRSRPHSVFQQHSSSISLATPTRPPPQFRGPPVVTVPQDRFPPHRRCRRHFSDLSAPLSGVFETLQAMGFLAPLAPRALPDPVPPQFRLDLYCAYHQSVGHHTDRCTALRHAIQDIVDSGTFGHPQSDMSLISTPAQAMHADAPSPAVPDLIDLGD